MIDGRGASPAAEAVRAPAADRWSVAFIVALLLLSPVVNEIVVRLAR